MFWVLNGDRTRVMFQILSRRAKNICFCALGARVSLKEGLGGGGGLEFSNQ